MKYVKKILKVFIFLVFYLLLCSFNNNNHKIAGKVELFFNEPFTQLGIVTKDNEIYFIDKNYIDYDKLLNLQQYWVIITGNVVLNELDDKVIIVNNYELAPITRISE